MQPYYKTSMFSSAEHDILLTDDYFSTIGYLNSPPENKATNTMMSEIRRFKFSTNFCIVCREGLSDTTYKFEDCCNYHAFCKTCINEAILDGGCNVCNCSRNIICVTQGGEVAYKVKDFNWLLREHLNRLEVKSATAQIILEILERSFSEDYLPMSNLCLGCFEETHGRWYYFFYQDHASHRYCKKCA